MAGVIRQLIIKAAEEHQTVRWRIREDFLQRSHFEEVVKSLDMNSSPGYPYLLSYPVNKDWFKYKDGVFDEGRLDLTWSLVLARVNKLLGSVQDQDHVRLFIKPEPLKEKKLKEHRYRLISSVSLIDQIIDHMLFDDMNQLMYDNCLSVPSKVGWSQFKGGWKFMPRNPWLAVDKSSWDWTVKNWMIDLVFRFRIALCQNFDTEIGRKWYDLAFMRYSMMYSSATFITSGGLVLKQKFPGVMKSGCVNTIADNSIMQYLLHLRACHEIGETPGVIMTMGDDTLQEDIPRRKEYLDKLSEFCIVKQAVIGNEFAGALFKGYQVEPLYCGKHAYTLLHAHPDVMEQLSNSYLLLYHRSHYRNWFELLFREMGLECVTREQRDQIYDGDE